MAITKSFLRFLLTQRDEYKLGTAGGRMGVLGVQDVHATHDEVSEIEKQSDVVVTPIPLDHRRFTDSQVVPRERNCAHVSDLFRMLGFEAVETLDFSDAEQPDVLHDLNNPIPEDLVGRYDVVLDIGVMEHVCDFRQAIENTIRMVKLGGSVVIILPLHGWHNMCFYNIQPPLLPEIYSANGFESISTYINFYPRYLQWIDRPLTYQEWRHGDEIEFVKQHHFTQICFLAKKMREVHPFVRPLQGFYVDYHGVRGEAPQSEPNESESPPIDSTAQSAKRIVRKPLTDTVRFLNRSVLPLKIWLEGKLPRQIRIELAARRRAREMRKQSQVRKRRVYTV